MLISITPKDFSFIVEGNLSEIFRLLSEAQAKINIMQNSAVSFSILLDEKKTDLAKILNLFHDSYHVRYNQGLELVTIRHYNQETIDNISQGKEILLQQRTRQTARFVLKDSE